MSTIYKQRMTAQIEGDFVVFLIGMRINKWWKFSKWLPVFLGMDKMLKELYTQPESGFLGHTAAGLVIIQYWRSFDHLEAYARSKDHAHWPAWVAFNKHVRHGDGDVGIWHETYQVAAGAYEAIYGGMPAIGLGKASKLVPIAGYHQNARGRMHSAGDGTEGKHSEMRETEMKDTESAAVTA